MSDPTREEMLAFIATLPYEDECSEFDIEGAIYWFGNDYHGGQDSNLYLAMCNSPYHPGPLCAGPDPESTEADIYAELEAEFRPHR